MATPMTQLKAWFKRGLKPAQEHFYALFDSFFHKDEDQIPISSVTNLSDHLNGKYPDESGKELEKRLTAAENTIDIERKANILAFKQVDEELDEIRSGTTDFTQKLNEHAQENRQEFDGINEKLEAHAGDLRNHELHFVSMDNQLEYLSKEAGDLRDDLEDLQQGNFLKETEKGVPGGVATLNAIGKLEASQIPDNIKTPLLDTYLSQNVDVAPTANALNSLYLYILSIRAEWRNEIAAVEDQLKDSAELGVAPSTISATGVAGQQIIYIKTSGAWTVDGLPAWISADKTSGTGNDTVVLSLAANATESSRSVTITITNQYGKSKQVTLNQAARAITYEYKLSVEPTELVVGGTGGTKGLAVASTREKYVNGVYDSVENVNYTISPAENWVTVSGNELTISANTSETNIRETVVAIQQTGGKTIQVPISQGVAVVTWEYALSVSPTSMSFAGGGETKAFTIISTKQKKINGVNSGSAVAVGTENRINGTGFTLSGNNAVAAANQTEVTRTGTVTVTQAESGKTSAISLNQAAGVVTWEYALSVSPTSMSFAGGGETKAFTVISTKQKKINGVNSGSAVAVSSSNAITGTGFTLSGNNAVAAANQTEVTRTGTVTVTQAESGKTATVSLNQAAGVVTWEYALSVSPTSMSFAGGGETKAFTVISTKQKKINGVNSGSAVAVSSSNAITGTGFTLSGNNAVAAANQTEVTRTGTVTITQAESGKTATVSLNQAAGVVTWEYALSVSPTSMSFAGGGETKAFTVISTKQKKINGVNSGSAVAVSSSNAITGTGFTLSGNNAVAASNQTGFARAGTVTITQAESGKTAVISLSQQVATVSMEFQVVMTGQGLQSLINCQGTLKIAGQSFPISFQDGRDTYTGTINLTQGGDVTFDTSELILSLSYTSPFAVNRFALFNRTTGKTVGSVSGKTTLTTQVNDNLLPGIDIEIDVP